MQSFRIDNHQHTRANDSRVHLVLRTARAAAIFLAMIANASVAAQSPADRNSRDTIAAKASSDSNSVVVSKDAAPAGPPERGDEDKPIQLAYVEGDIAGMSSILSEDGKTLIGMIEYRQHRRGDILEISRIARFKDGSSDEDKIQAHVGKTLRTIGGRSIIRNTAGVATVDLKMDVAARRITGFSGLGKKRETYDQEAELSPATYWGPLIAIVLKNFDENAVDGHLEFHSVIATPKPRVFDMEFIRKEKTSMTRAGSKIDVARYALSPSINPLLDPLIRMIAPDTDFYIQAGSPPAMARFAGPRNYAGQKIRIE